MASSSRSRYSEDSQDLSSRYNRILLQSDASRDIARRSSDDYKLTLVGSAASGVDIQGISDIDVLIEPRNIIINESSLRYRPDIPCYVRIFTEGLAGHLPRVILGDGKYVLAGPVRSRNAAIFGETNFGPHSDFSKVGHVYFARNSYIDIVPQLKISGMPQTVTVRSFATRDRLWPSPDIISIITSGEFHLIARKAPTCPDREHDFCLSFAKAEVVLLNTMSVNQKETIKYMKIIGREIDVDRRKLKSYQLKTTALWYFEKTEARLWENGLPVVDILKRLNKYLNDRLLLHYFVPEMNLLVDFSESDLMYVRMRLSSFLMLCRILDIPGVPSRTRLNLAVNVFIDVNRQQHPVESDSSRDIARLSTGRYKMTLVGSLARGVDFTGSDADILIEPRDIIIDESSLRYRDDMPCYVRISTEGLAGLVPNVLLGDGKYLLAHPVRDMCEDIFGDCIVPLLSKVGNISIDIVPQLRISGMPQIVRPFATRDRSWPRSDIISVISSGEFHLAARPAPTCPDMEHDFCLSFAKAEVVLLRTMSINQIDTIKMLKKIVGVVDIDRGTLTSYHLKTSALWYFEQTDARLCENDLPVVHILKRLDQYLHDRFLPHYFVPEMNLLAGIPESDLMYVRRHLWSFLGLCLITDNIAGINSHMRLDLTLNMFDKSYPAWTQTGCVYNTCNTLEAAEVMYGTGAVSHEFRRDGIDKCKQLIKSISKTTERLTCSIQLESVKYNNFVQIMYFIEDSYKEPLEELFVIRSASKNKVGGREIRRQLGKSENIMNKWLSFVDYIINKLQPCGSVVADKVIVGVSQKSRADRRVGSNLCAENIDKLFNEINKALLTFAVWHTDTFGYPLDNDYCPIRPASVSDFRANIHILNDVIDRLFLSVEYALVVSARIKAPLGSGDQTGRIIRMMNPESIEYRCYLAYLDLYKVMRDFGGTYLVSDSQQQCMESWPPHSTESRVRRMIRH